MRLSIILLLVLGAQFGIHAQTNKMDKTEFTKIFAVKLKENFNAHDAKPQGELQVLLVWTPAEGASTLYDLEESYNMYVSSDQDFDSQFYMLLSVAEEKSPEEGESSEVSMPVASDDPRSYIVPVIKSKEWVYNAGQEDLHVLEYNEDLAIVFAEDEERLVSYLTKTELEEYGLSGDSLLALALTNFELRIFPSFSFELEEDESSFALYLDNVYESTLLLFLDEFWDKMATLMDGDLVIMVPNRNFVAGTSSGYKDKIKRFKKFAKKYYNSQRYPISPYLYKWNGERFVRFEE